MYLNGQNKGHYPANRPHSALFCRMPGGNSSIVDQPMVQGSEIFRSGKVEGTEVKDILLDTGCSMYNSVMQGFGTRR